MTYAIFKRCFKREVKFVFVVFAIILFQFVFSYINISNKVDAAYDFAYEANGNFTSDQVYEKFFADPDMPEHFRYGGVGKHNIQVPNTIGIVNNAIDNINDINAVLAVAGAVVFAFLSFYDERKKNTVGFVGALPYSRSRIYTEKWLSGFLLLAFVLALGKLFAYFYYCLLAPKALAAAELFGIEAKFYCVENIDGIILSIIATFLFYSIIMFINTMFGRLYYSLAVIAILYIGLMGFITGFASFYHMYEITFSLSFLRRVLSFMDKLSIVDYDIIFGVATAVFYALGVLTNSLAKNERIGNIFIFKPIKYLFYVAVTVMGAFTFFAFVYSIDIFNADTLAKGFAILLAGAVMTVFILRKMFAFDRL